MNRRTFIHHLGCASAALGTALWAEAGPPEGFVPLFDGRTLGGWKQRPRIGYRPPKEGATPEQVAFFETSLRHHGQWTVEDGAIVGRQDGPRLKHPVTGQDFGFGGYLVSERTYGDFELRYEARPDWPADTGVYLRATGRDDSATAGLQVLLDHRLRGAIGFIYGNSIGGFHARPFEFEGELDAAGRLRRLVPATVPDYAEHPLSHAASPEEFLGAWRLNDWNAFRVRCVGELPQITVWVNGAKICEFDGARYRHPKYDRDTVVKALGRRGHIALEAHDGSEQVWARTSACRFRHLFIKELA